MLTSNEANTSPQSGMTTSVTAPNPALARNNRPEGIRPAASAKPEGSPAVTLVALPVTTSAGSEDSSAPASEEKNCAD